LKARKGIFGGSFDPVHKGHVRTVESFLKSGLLDDLLILLTPSPPHKKNQQQADYSHRMEMLKLAFEGTENVQLSDLETKLPQPSYTLQAIEHLQKQNPETVLFLCLGEDSLCDFDQWFQYRKILEYVNLIVAERPGFDSSKVDPQILEYTIFVDHQPVNISSTGFRSEQSSEIVPESVARYIEKHNLYR
jgi:nicotinate-nucleotide adenylyltransferase